jgi:hypothetical protein
MNRAHLSALVVLCSTPALADVTMVSEVLSQGKTRNVTLSVKGTKAYFDLREEGGPSRGMLRDSAQKKMWLVDHDKKSVILMTEEDSKAIEARQEQMRLQMKAQLERLPPEQRTRMEQTMLAMPDPNAKPPNFTYEKKKGATARTVSGFKCEDYLIKREGQPFGEGCFTPWKTVGITAEEFKKTLINAMPSSAAAGPMMQSFEAHTTAPGLSVERTLVDDKGQVTTRTTMKSFSKTALAADKFEVPKDYVEKSMKDLSGPGGGKPLPAPSPAPAKP